MPLKDHISPTSKKRPADDAAEPSTSKITKVHPFFRKPATDGEPSFRWLQPLGPKQSLLHALNLEPVICCKVAAFDLDGTVIESNVRNATTEWKWWKSGVPSKLAEAHRSGYSLVIISNQGIRAEKLKTWKEKVQLVASALPNVPFRLFAATAKDGFRKPMPGMWNELERIFAESNVHIDKESSFFVGDAAGRKGDFAGTDRKWALNVGIKFYTPEEYFLGLPPAPYELTGFHVSSLLSNVPLFTPTSTPLLPIPTKDVLPLEIVLFVGYPAVGKTSFFRRHFEPTGYVHINQDTLGTKAKCLKAAEAALAEGKSCVVDNTNRDAQTRQAYISLARKRKASIRCFYFTASMELAWHNNLYRAYNMPPSVADREAERTAIPYMAFTGYRSAFEEPKLDEGFSEIKRINWVWEGSEDEKRYWSMWLQVDGRRVYSLSRQWDIHIPRGYYHIVTVQKSIQQRSQKLTIQNS